jgi:hypothetical protein
MDELETFRKKPRLHSPGNIAQDIMKSRNQEDDTYTNSLSNQAI